MSGSAAAALTAVPAGSAQLASAQTVRAQLPTAMPVSGIERVTELNVSVFVPVAEVQNAQLPADSGYFHGSDEFFEQIGAVEAVPDRMIIFQGSLLHSGIIPPDMPLTGDPRQGRLTANIFVRGH